MGLDEVKKAMAGLLENLKTKLQATGKKLPLHSIWTVVQESIASVVLLIENKVGSSLSGPEKKAAALEYVANVIDTVALLIDIPGVPEWIESKLDYYIKQFLLAIASGSIDAIVSTFKETGVFPPKVVPPVEPQPEPDKEVK